MTGTISPDGQWLWNGSEWIPAPPSVSPEVVEESAPLVEAAAQEHNLNVQELQVQSQNFDLNQDNQLSQNEINMAAQSMVTPPNVGYPNQQMVPDSQMMGNPQMMGGPQTMPANQMGQSHPNTFNSDNIMMSQPGNNNKVIITVAIVFVALLIGSVSIYFWASTLADDASSGSLNTDSDDDADGITNEFDLCQDTNPGAIVDADGCADYQRDSDGDGYTDDIDEFPNDASEHSDWDGDGYGDNSDAFPYDSTEWLDSDGDGYGNNEDLLPGGDAYIKFEVNSLAADNNDNYDFGTSPDMYMYVQLDWNCDEVYDVTRRSSTHQDDYYVNSNDGMYVTADIAEDESVICFSLRIYDEDDSDDDILDYVSGEGEYYIFTRTVTQSGTINLVYSSSDYKSVDIDIDVYIW